ncbi:MAG: ACP S-malonyltransferase [Planctomycetes bacterium]|nr:ACP S-malonyltransferase [Planctomycetota bacterium]
MIESTLRAALFCPGRGSYTAASLGTLDRSHPFTQRADALRAEFGLALLTELDGAPSFKPALHLAPANVSALIYVATMQDAEIATSTHRLVAVGGNSLGWYTALAVGGALSFDDGFRLVQTMALEQEAFQSSHGGGQILFPIVGDDWRVDATRVAAVADVLERSNGELLRSIRLGGFEVLAGSDAGIAHGMAQLPPTKFGKNAFPLQLAQHGPYHTRFVFSVAAAAARRLEGLAFRAPRVTLVDGRGARFSPWDTDVDALRAYTLGTQVTTPFDFDASVCVALREFGPQRIVLPGPGNTLGSIVGQILIAEGFAGITDRASFERHAEFIVSMRR